MQFFCVSFIFYVQQIYNQFLIDGILIIFRMTYEQSYAPFGSSSIKIKKIKNQRSASSQPGPGSYDISLPIIQPIVQTIKKKNNNVIVKLGHIGTASFQGINQRFGSSQTEVVGPGQYESQINHKQYKLKQPRTIAAQKISKMIQSKLFKRLPTIPLPKSLELDAYIQMPDFNNVGQQKKKSRISTQKDSIWSKIASLNIQSRQKKNEIGPGYYQLQNNRSKQSLSLSPSFASSGVRSFFDNILFQTNKDQKARQRLKNNYKSNQIGPGSYEISNTQKLPNSKFQFFGSTTERI